MERVERRQSIGLIGKRTVGLPLFTEKGEGAVIISEFAARHQEDM